MCVSDSRITEKSLGSTSKVPRVACVGAIDKMDVEKPVIDATLVRRVVAAQFPQWADLPVRSAAETRLDFVEGLDRRSGSRRDEYCRGGATLARH